MKKIAFLFYCFLCILSGCRQPTSLIQSVTPPVAPAIKVSNLEQGESPVIPMQVITDVQLMGNIAVTTLEMTFYNPNDRILEGEFAFPLNQGADVIRFGLDIEDKLRDGVIVEKRKGRRIFEEITRAEVDPGLLEKTEGNNFRTRIYPLPPKGHRRIIIAYEEVLNHTEGKLNYTLPLFYSNHLDSLSVSITAFNPESSPFITESPFPSSFEKRGNSYEYSFTGNHIQPQNYIKIELADTNRNQLVIEKNKAGKSYTFYTHLYPALHTIQKEKPSRIALFWDSSLSMEKQDHNQAIDFLENYLKNCGSTQIELYPFSTISYPVESYKIRHGQTGKLSKRLKNMVYDGGTCTGQPELKDIEADEIWIYSDGLNNTGEAVPQTGAIPVYCITSGRQADYSFLNHLATQTGGLFFNMNHLSQEEALKKALLKPYRLLSVTHDPAEIDELVFSSSIINHTEGISVSGKLKVPHSKLQLHFGTDNHPIHTETITLSSEQAEEMNGLIERRWATLKIRELDGEYEKYRQQIEELGKIYSIVTRNTSLIVLDNIEDYVRYDITPPAELLDEYIKLKKQYARTLEKRHTYHLEYITNLFLQRKEWWEKEDYRMHGYMRMYRERNWNREFPLPDFAPDENEIVNYTPEEVGEAIESLIWDEDYINAEVRACDIRIPPKKEFNHNPDFRSSIELMAIVPETDYLNKLKNTPNHKLYKTYLELREKYKRNAVFYMDVAQLFYSKGFQEKAFLILSNIAEIDLDNHRLLRGMAYQAQAWGYLDCALYLYNKIRTERPDEPQSLRDLALACAEAQQYQKAIDLLYQIAESPWDDRFPEIEIIALVEMNEIITRAGRENIAVSTSHIPQELLYHMPSNIRVVMRWNTDNSDMDLWITDPEGIECYYSEPNTAAGGYLSKDFMQGYGPEEYFIKKVMEGVYTIEVNYYGTAVQTLLEPVILMMDIYTHFGEEKEEKKTAIFRLSNEREMLTIAQILIE